MTAAQGNKFAVRWYEYAVVILLGAFFMWVSTLMQQRTASERDHRVACQRSGFIDVVYISGTAYCARVDAGTSTLTKSPLYLAQEQQ